MHYVMAHESDEVKKETQALMGDASRVGRVCEIMRFAANAEKHKDIRTKEHKNNSASRHTGMDLRPCALKNIRATP